MLSASGKRAPRANKPNYCIYRLTGAGELPRGRGGVEPLSGIGAVGRWKIAGIVILAGLLGIVGGWGGLLIKAEARRAKAAPTGIATRPELIKRLERQPGQQLVIVRYGADHDVHQEWVYNRANIDAAKIVWAQDMGEEKNRELLNYFPGRTVWLLEPDTDPLTVRTYE